MSETVTELTAALIEGTRSLAEYRRGKLSEKKRTDLLALHDAHLKAAAAIDELLGELDPNAFAIECERFERMRQGL